MGEETRAHSFIYLPDVCRGSWGSPRRLCFPFLCRHALPWAVTARAGQHLSIAPHGAGDVGAQPVLRDVCAEEHTRACLAQLAHDTRVACIHNSYLAGGGGWGTENGQVVVVSDVSETAIHECLRSSPGLQMPSL